MSTVHVITCVGSSHPGGYTFPIISEEDWTEKKVTKLLKRFVKRAKKRGEYVFSTIE